MFNNGDRVVCVRVDNYSIKINSIYTIECGWNVTFWDDSTKAVTLVEDIHYHHENCFISIKKYRKQKLEKIYGILN